jgi:glycosyltransferase involved in cell wall biosynthesis
MKPETKGIRIETTQAEQDGPGRNGVPLLSVVIPALNEQDSIADIVRRVMATEGALEQVGVRGLEVIVVDDGSKDRTAEIAAAIPGVRLQRHPENRGYGAAIKTGFSQARGEFLAFLDADGTYPPEYLPALCRPLLQGSADVVVGSRRSGAHSRMPPVRRLGNFLWSNLVSLIGRGRCLDPASGMRVLRRSDGLNFTPVMSTRTLHESLRVVELPIPYEERRGRSKLSVVRDGTRFLKTILWTSLEYNPVKVLGLIAILFLAVAALIGLGLVLLRLQGIKTVGAWGVFALFGALVLSVSGVSIYTLGVTFNYVVSLFHRRPLRQGLFASPLLEQVLEPQFGWIGLSSIAMGASLGILTMILGAVGWEISRLWLWLLGSALFVLVGFQLAISWLVARVLETLAEREDRLDQDLRFDTALESDHKSNHTRDGNVREIPAVR